MSRTTVSGVETGAGPGLAGAGIDSPVAGDDRPDWTVDVRGWAIGAGRDVVAAAGYHDGQKLWQVPLDVERPNTAAKQGARDDRIGFHALTGALRLAPEFELEVRALARDGSEAAIGTVRGQRELLRTAVEPRRNPVLVTTFGRTGSMLLLRLLSAHPEVLVYRPHRFEQRIAGYWADVLLSLAEPSAYIRQVAPPPDVEDPAWWLGRGRPMPWGLRDAGVQQWLGGEAIEDLAAVSVQRIEATYDRIVATTDTADAALFAEKSNLRASALITELYPQAREVFLVRDLRDMVASILSFNEQRGAQGFGRAAAGTDRDYVSSLGGWATGLVRAWERRRDRAQLVRYEDLIGDPERTLADLLAYLGVDSSPAAVESLRAALGEEMPELARHATSEKPQASVGRWRRDLPADLIAETERSLGAALETFGYS